MGRSRNKPAYRIQTIGGYDCLVWDTDGGSKESAVAQEASAVRAIESTIPQGLNPIGDIPRTLLQLPGLCSLANTLRTF